MSRMQAQLENLACTWAGFSPLRGERTDEARRRSTLLAARLTRWFRLSALCRPIGSYVPDWQDGLTGRLLWPYTSVSAGILDLTTDNLALSVVKYSPSVISI
jgi:hypothetical protein